MWGKCRTTKNTKETLNIILNLLLTNKWHFFAGMLNSSVLVHADTRENLASGLTEDLINQFGGGRGEIRHAYIL